MIFYVVKHETFENENVIFLNKDIALEYIKKKNKGIK